MRSAVTVGRPASAECRSRQCIKIAEQHVSKLSTHLEFPVSTFKKQFPEQGQLGMLVEQGFTGTPGVGTHWPKASDGQAQAAFNGDVQNAREEQGACSSCSFSCGQHAHSTLAELKYWQILRHFAAGNTGAAAVAIPRLPIDKSIVFEQIIAKGGPW